ncbi:unnamed protein product [Ostreobium quekettii]|uniref:Uncharacterized protein n=1 Tax=Ostreobium quekettii TaxID=121088 RepID=A0A8S1IZD9_9CHLO|nr:unnamed protein product [Ostreobium quekettii]|eukprot:evm.model.scf_349.1 EVM.evm.TU.scf_349.1   scf_349:8988-11195(+)
MSAASQGSQETLGVVLIEPPCVVSGKDSEVAIHLSRPVPLANSHEVVVASDGELVANAPLSPAMGKTLSLDLPPIGSCGVYVTITGVAEEPDSKAPCMLSLPAEAAEEVCELFSRMLSDMMASYADSPSELLYVPAGCDPPPQPAWMGRGGSSRQWLEGDTPLREAVWASHLQPFIADFAALLEGLSAGNSDSHGACVPMVMYLLQARLWNTASFLLTSCLAHGVPVTLGPFALSAVDVEAHRLKADFLAMASRAEGLCVGEGAGGVEERGVSVGAIRGLHTCGSNSGSPLESGHFAGNTAASS